MRVFLHAVFAAVLAPTALAEVKVNVGDINDTRMTEKFFSGLEIELNLNGPELAEATGIRTTLKSATDDTGKALAKSEEHFDNNDGLAELQKAFGGRFEELRNPFGGDRKADELQLKLKFASPPRSAKAIKALEGTIELLIPSKDPAASITASVAKDAGKPLENAALKAAGVQISLLKPGGTDDKKDDGVGGFGDSLGENDLGYKITDPNKKVGLVEFFDSAGKKLETNGRGTGGFIGYNIVRISFNAKPPADAVAKIYIVTDKSVVTVPLALKDIVLP